MQVPEGGTSTISTNLWEDWMPVKGKYGLKFQMVLTFLTTRSLFDHAPN
jgi:hypothetical protein